MTIAKFAGDVYTDEGRFHVNLWRTWNHHGINLSRLPRRVVGRMGMEKDAPAEWLQAGHRLVTRLSYCEREHLANPSIDLEMHIQDILNVIRYEDLRDIVLIGHSYAAWSQPAWPTARGTALPRLIYSTAFVPDDGTVLIWI